MAAGTATPVIRHDSVGPATGLGGCALEGGQAFGTAVEGTWTIAVVAAPTPDALPACRDRTPSD